MRYLSFSEVLAIYQAVIKQSGGTYGLRDPGALQSALAQPRMTFGGQDLYPTIVEKASTLGFLLIKNHPFVDGNKRTGHAAIEVFLLLNGYELKADVDEQEQVILQVAANEMDRESFASWLRTRVVRKAP